MNNIYHVKEFHYDEFLGLLQTKGFKVKSKYGQAIPYNQHYMELLLT